MKEILAVLLVIGALASVPFIAFEAHEYFAPRFAAVTREVFKESPSYNDGMVRDLENLMMEYKAASKEHQPALRSVILHRFSIYPEDKLPANLLSFYVQLRSEQ
jgi:hypothetical protein